MSVKQIVLVSIYILSLNSIAQTIDTNNKTFYNTASKYFKAWELVSEKYYNLKDIKPTEFLLFDDKYLYTTSDVSGKEGEIIKGPNIFNHRFIWKKKEHNGNLILPDGQERKVGIMAFSYALSGQKAKAFFVMPLTDFWVSHNVDDHGIGLQKLTTGVFVHEFGHSQQFEDGYNGMENGAFDKYFTDHPNEVSMDDIMQDIYSNDKIYVKDYEDELNMFINAYNAKSKEEMKQLAHKAIEMLEKRQKRILTDDKRDLSEIDNYWLTLEGVAQYSSFLWLTDSKGGKLSTQNAIKALETASWSQEEGFAIVYLFSKFSNPKDWSKKMFRSKTINIIELLKNEIN